MASHKHPSHAIRAAFPTARSRIGLRFFTYIKTSEPDVMFVAFDAYPWKFRRAVAAMQAAGWMPEEIWNQPAPGLFRERWDVTIPKKAGPHR